MVFTPSIQNSLLLEWLCVMIFATVNDVTSIINNFLWSFKGMRDEKSNIIVSNFALRHYPCIHVAMVTVTSE